MTSQMRMITTMMGNYPKHPNVHTKHTYLFGALSKRYELVEIFDASLRGVSRWLNAFSVAEANRTRWREHFYKNPTAFRKRSKRASAFLRSRKDEADFALQIGVMFDSNSESKCLPTVIYCDYTSALSARKQEAVYSPFTSAEREEWLALQKAALHRASHICARSHLARNSFINDYGIPVEKTTVIGGGVNFDKLPALDPSPKQNGPVALFVGKEFYRKGGDVVLKAFSKVRSQIPSARLILVTAGPIPREYSLENVEVIDQHCDRKRIAHFYRTADLFVLPSRLETWGDVLLEAMAYGLPCIGVYGDAMEEIINQDRTGFLITPEDSDSLADRMILLMNHSELRRSMGNAARKRVESDFLWDHVVERLAPVVEAVVHRRYGLDIPCENAVPS